MLRPTCKHPKQMLCLLFPQHAPHYQGNFNVHTKETVESMVLHKGHPNAPGRGPVLDVRGVMKKLVLLRLFLVFARVNGVIIAITVPVVTKRLNSVVFAK